MTQIIAESGVNQHHLVSCAISPRAYETIHLSLFADMSIVTIKRAILPGDESRKQYATRGSISQLSRKSRKRMIEKLAKKRNYERPLFLTLTYPDQAWFDLEKTNDDLERDRDTFLKRLMRKYPHVGLIWRKEWERRKSGNHKGETVPHLHIIIDGLLEDVAELRKEFREWWMEVITLDNCLVLTKGCRIDLQVAKSRRHAMYYISKYVAKVEDKSVEKEDDTDICQPVDTGRIWGVMGNWDTSESLTVKLTHAQYIQWRRLVSRWLKSKGSHYAKRIKQQSPNVGAAVFGLGDMSCIEYDTLYESAAFKLLLHVLTLA